MKSIKAKIRNYLIDKAISYVNWCIETSDDNEERNYWISEKNKFNREFKK